MMLNFREKLRKTRQEKLRRYEEKSEAIEKVLDHVIKYLELKTIPQFLSRTQILFTVSKKNLCVKEIKNGRKDVEPFYQEICESEKDACNLLISVEEELNKDGYESLPEFGTAKLSGCFCVEIDASR